MKQMEGRYPARFYLVTYPTILYGDIRSLAILHHRLQLLPPMTWTETHMNPVEVVLVNQLVKRQFQFHNQVKELLVLFGSVLNRPDVGSLSFLVLTRCRAFHDLVQSLAPVAARHDNRLAVCLTERVKHLLHKCRQVRFLLTARFVLDAILQGGVALRQFSDGKVFHNRQLLDSQNFLHLILTLVHLRGNLTNQGVFQQLQEEELRVEYQHTGAGAPAFH